MLRSFRERKELSQEGLADLAGLHRTYIGGIERAERNVSFASIRRILSVLNVTWEQFGRAIDEGLAQLPRARTASHHSRMMKSSTTNHPTGHNVSRDHTREQATNPLAARTQNRGRAGKRAP